MSAPRRQQSSSSRRCRRRDRRERLSSIRTASIVRASSISARSRTPRSQNHPVSLSSARPPIAQSAAARTVLSTPSESSHGIVSHESSPPVSPCPFSSTDDLKRFRNLFWKLNGRALSASSSAAAGSSRPSPLGASSQSLSSAGVSFDVSSHSTTSQSGGGLEVMPEHDDEALIGPVSHLMYGGR